MDKSGKPTEYQSGYMRHLEEILNVDEAMERIQNWREESVGLSGKVKINKNEDSHHKHKQPQEVKQKMTYQDGRPNVERWYQQRQHSRLEPRSLRVTPEEIYSRRESWSESLEDGNYQILRRAVALTARWRQSEYYLKRRPVTQPPIPKSASKHKPVASNANFPKNKADRQHFKGRKEMGDNMVVNSKPKTAEDTSGKKIGSIPRPHTYSSIRRKHDLSLRSDYATLRVGNLSGEAGTSDLQALFSKALTVTKPIPETGCDNLLFFAFVIFPSSNDAAEALRKYQGSRIQGQSIILTYRQYKA